MPGIGTSINIRRTSVYRYVPRSNIVRQTIFYSTIRARRCPGLQTVPHFAICTLTFVRRGRLDYSLFDFPVTRDARELADSLENWIISAAFARLYDIRFLITVYRIDAIRYDVRNNRGNRESVTHQTCSLEIVNRD